MSLSEELRVREWEFECMCRLGVPAEVAVSLAEGGVSHHDVAPLVAGGCPPGLLPRLLLDAVADVAAFEAAAGSDSDLRAEVSGGAA